MRIATQFLKILLTLVMVAVALVLGTALWQHYMLEPWTRDGRVSADVVAVAPEISGRVVELKVIDNQLVHKGDPLFTIDPTDYRLALAKAEAVAENRRQQMQVKAADAQRRVVLSKAGVASAEVTEDFRGSAAIAAADYQEAQVAVNQAEVDLERTVVRAPVNGYVTNLLLRVGDYVTTGHNDVAIVDSDSFRITGYFEETKLAAIRPGAPATARLLGYPHDVTGHVESISRAITDANDGSNRVGLATVNPVFTWVRLAQRFPVRIHIDKVPPDVVLAAGLTCTVAVLSPEDRPQTLRQRIERAVATLNQLLGGRDRG
jgi:RND family efflux transporter MFP subunit